MISREMKFAGYFSYLLMAETLLLVAGQSLYDYSLNAGLREAVRRAGMINLNFETSKKPSPCSNSERILDTFVKCLLSAKREVCTLNVRV